LGLHGIVVCGASKYSGGQIGYQVIQLCFLSRASAGVGVNYWSHMEAFVSNNNYIYGL